jgi:hypothetical protein
MVEEKLNVESALVRHNHLGEMYSIKLVHPGYYLTLKPGDLVTTIRFYMTKERLAKRVRPGHLLFVYVTAPEKRIVGMAQVVEPAEFLPEKDYKRPWSVKMAWVIGPKSGGVSFADIGFNVKPRIGDSTYGITQEVAAAIIEKLQEMKDLDEGGLAVLKQRYGMFA